MEQELLLLQLLAVHGVALRLLHLVTVGDGRVEQKLAKALDRQDVERTLGRLDEIGQPRHGLAGALALKDVQEEVRVAAPAKKMPDLVVLKKTGNSELSNAPSEVNTTLDGKVNRLHLYQMKDRSLKQTNHKSEISAPTPTNGTQPVVDGITGPG